MSTPRQALKEPTSGMKQPPPCLSNDVEQALLQRALAGEKVRDEIILSLQSCIHSLATNYARPDKGAEHMDLVQEANATLYQCFERALTKENPFAYLLQTARIVMINCVNGRGDLIRTHTSQDPVTVVSLDQPIRDDLEDATLADLIPGEDVLLSERSISSEDADRTVTLLHQAIEALPDTCRIVIQRHYGFGFQPESLNEIGRSLSQKSRSRTPSNAHYYKKCALKALRQQLAPLFPQYAGGIQ